MTRNKKDKSNMTPYFHNLCGFIASGKTFSATIMFFLKAPHQYIFLTLRKTSSRTFTWICTIVFVSSANTCGPLSTTNYSYLKVKLCPTDTRHPRDSYFCSIGATGWDNMRHHGNTTLWVDTGFITLEPMNLSARWCRAAVCSIALSLPPDETNYFWWLPTFLAWYVVIQKFVDMVLPPIK